MAQLPKRTPKGAMTRAKKRPSVRIIVETVEGYPIHTAEVTLNKAVLRKNLKPHELYLCIAAAEEVASNMVFDALMEVMAER